MEPKLPTSPVALQCVAAFSHLYGQSLGCSQGIFHIGSDGAVTEPPAIAAELLDLRFAAPDEPGERAVFETASPADAALVQSYRDALREIALQGEELGPLVVIECLAFAGQLLGASGGQTLNFDTFGQATVGERVYQELRPAFGGDGSNPDPDAPALRFLGFAKELEAQQQADLEGVDLEIGAPILTPLTPPVVPEYDPREPDTNGMGPTQPNAAAREMAQFNAASPLDVTAKAEASETANGETANGETANGETATPAATAPRSRSKATK